MDEFRFPHLTAGYIGQKFTNATLNAAFYALIFSNESQLRDNILFPQRIPKSDFFAEICQFETKEVQALFSAFRKSLLKKTHSLVSNKIPDPPMVREALNRRHLLLRFGLWQELLTTPFFSENKVTPSEWLEFMLLNQIATISLNMVEGKSTPIEALAHLVEVASNSTHIGWRIRLFTLNYAVVASYRFGIKLSYATHLEKCCQQILALINVQDGSFPAQIRCSIAYRGLAMVTELGTTMQDELMNKAENLARSAIPTNLLEALIAKENLYTCLQTLSKWHSTRNQIISAENHLQEMIRLDPYDSTGYAEMGFFLLNLNRFEEAGEHFHRAAKLGPPGVGMHTYYYGKCLESVGKDVEAIKILTKAAELDRMAISPWLDMIDIYSRLKNLSAAKQCAKYILRSEQLGSQLDEVERKELNNLINVNEDEYAKHATTL